jgi:predicted glycoside hydrolase/deacetylase ChbG (UPF0249 family)
MAVGPAFEDAARLFRNRPDVCLGLHVTLHAEWETVKWRPVLPPEQVPSLVDNHGYFWASPAEGKARGANVEEMMAEVEAQWARARDHGLPIAYIDEHMGASWPWPALRAQIADMAAREGLIDDPSLRFSPRPQISLPTDTPAEALRLFINVLLPGTYVYVTHPGFEAEDMRRLHLPGQPPGEVSRERDGDRLAWQDAAVQALCRERNIEVIRYTDVADLEPS